MAPATTRMLAIEANPAEVRRASLWLEQCARALSIPQPALHRLDLCLNEALANLIDHGGAEVHATPVQLEIAVSHNHTRGEACLRISDGGRCFDPGSHQSGPVPRTIAQAEPGGLGLVMIRAFSDALRYAQRNGRNELSLWVRWPAGKGLSHGGGSGEPDHDSLPLPPPGTSTFSLQP